MATANGLHAIDDLIPKASHLGKRKRSTSPESHDTVPALPKPAPLQQNLDHALEIIQRHDVAGELLKQTLPFLSDSHLPTTKRRRTQSTDSQPNTIESRIKSQTYTSYQQFMEDVAAAGESISPRLNGHKNNEPLAEKTTFDKIWALLCETQDKIQNQSLKLNVDSHHLTSAGAVRTTLELLSLRGQTEGGVRQLFTGLPDEVRALSAEARSKKLPNGFEIIESALIDPSTAKPQDKRTFGEVFFAHRSLKPLDLPRQFPGKQDAPEFIPALSNLGMNNKLDYRNLALATGSWIQYSTSELKSPNAPATEVRPRTGTVDSLFRSAFSSFAPTGDDNNSMITGSDRAQRWYKTNTPSSTKFVDDKVSIEEDVVQRDGEEEVADNFEEILANFISESDLKIRDEGEELLEEVSGLLQTLSSHQTIRDIESVREPGVPAKASQAEIDIYEMLKTQLRLLVDQLPPHAVSKLNGNQLGALNITAKLPVSVPELTGTGQADDYTLRRQKASQVASGVAGRTAADPNTRANYSTPVVPYGTQAQAFNQPVSATPYNARATTNVYATPRAGISTPTAPYSQQPYRSNANSYSTPVAQQYQQPALNKFGHSYTPRASQPGYQQRAQERGNAWARPASPQKPTMNGQAPQSYQMRPYSGQAPYTGAVSMPATNVPPRSVEQIKQQQIQSSVVDNPTA